VFAKPSRVAHETIGTIEAVGVLRARPLDLLSHLLATVGLHGNHPIRLPT